MFKIANELLQKMKEKIVGYQPCYTDINNKPGIVFGCDSYCYGRCEGNCEGDCCGSCKGYNR